MQISRFPVVATADLAVKEENGALQRS